MRLSNESYFSLNFIARKRQNKEGEQPISLRITMNGQRAEIYINRSVKPDDWNTSKGQSRGKTKKDLELNRYLDTVRTKICEILGSQEQAQNKRFSKEQSAPRLPLPALEPITGLYEWTVRSAKS